MALAQRKMVFMSKSQRVSLIYLSILILFCLGLGGYIYWQGNKAVVALDDLGKIYGNVQFISETADIYRFRVVGLSMYPTLKDGVVYHANKKAVPKVGDIIALQCLVERCQYEGMVKFVRGIDERGCYDLQGRDDAWVEEDGITYVSVDSSDFGSLCPGEIRVNGVVKTNAN